MTLDANAAHALVDELGALKQQRSDCLRAVAVLCGGPVALAAILGALVAGFGGFLLAAFLAGYGMGFPAMFMLSRVEDLDRAIARAARDAPRVAS